ncbi:hypothetical protein NC652_017274 [Populus alba x Populus x berolinensis]|nr:hypothetical protein NC652_017274 [Populus alba x Populus x berolinensis]
MGKGVNARKNLRTQNKSTNEITIELHSEEAWIPALEPLRAQAQEGGAHLGIKGKMIAKKNYAEKALMKKTLAYA